MKEYGYINENGCLVSRYFEDRVEKVKTEKGEIIDVIFSIEAQLEESGVDWKPVDPIDEERMISGEEFVTIKIVPVDNGDSIGYRYEPFHNPALITQRISKLQDELSSEDYKITKSYEASLVGEKLPYNMDELHAKRQGLRNRINDLKSLLQ